MYPRLLIAIPSLLLSIAAAAQQPKPYKFEKVDAAALSRKVYALDSSANAVVIADVGETQIEGNNKGWFSFVFRRHRRVHILRQSAYDEATLKIPVYHSGYQVEERIEGIKATSYNFEGGKVVETKMSKDAIFKEKMSNSLDVYKFTLPAVHEGTIIDIEYRLKSDYLFTLQPWDFQEEIPVLRSEYSLSVPQFFNYNFIYKGFVPFAVNEQQNRNEQFSVMDQTGTAGAADRFSFAAGVTDYRWSTIDVPAFREEKFLSARSNYQAHIEFQLAGLQYPLSPRSYVRSWPEMTGELLKDEQFGKKLDRDNPWLKETMRPLMQGTRTQQARAIYAWVRDNINCSGQRGLYLQNGLKDVLRAGKGTVAEVNLLLVTMLRYAGLEADPVMLSTRDNGTVYTSFPMLTRFNYIIATLELDGKTTLLDASKPGLGFGQLLPDCYNGIARVVSKSADALILQTDSLREKDLTILSLQQKGANWEGTYQSVSGNYGSYNLRKKLVESGRDAFYASLRTSLGNGAEFRNGSIDSVNQLEQPVGIRGEVKIPIGTDDLLYLNPMFGEGYSENPFHSAERIYPVEMPYATDRTFLLTMRIPEGYEIDELPKQMRVALDEKGSGSFDYLISVSNGMIMLKSQIRINRTTFVPDDYENLREFFNMVVAKQKEKFVFRKKK